MTPELKAIETRYKGYRFRSRLEARWAVFFDAAHIPWEYEKEGFDLPKSGPYLPDFWLPTGKVWLEVKPAEPTVEEMLKCQELVRLGGDNCLMVWSVPEKDSICLILHKTSADLVPTDHDLLYAAILKSISNRDVSRGEWSRIWGLLEAASDAAKSARFEFGEQG